jgi:hypothetical protein
MVRHPNVNIRTLLVHVKSSVVVAVASVVAVAIAANISAAAVT